MIRALSIIFIASMGILITIGIHLRSTDSYNEPSIQKNHIISMGGRYFYVNDFLYYSYYGLTFIILGMVLFGVCLSICRKRNGK
jgi:hypothetical protein